MVNFNAKTLKKRTFIGISAAGCLLLMGQGLILTYQEAVQAVDSFAVSRVEAKHLVAPKTETTVVPVITKTDAKDLLK